MDYSGPSYSSLVYLTLDRAMEVSGLTLPELKRAIVLGFIKVADIGNTTFVDSLSLAEYTGSRERNFSEIRNTGTPSVFFKASELFPEDNHTSPKEREVFREALARDTTAGNPLSTVPYVSVGIFIFIALLLSLPAPQDTGTENLISAEEYYARGSLKEITTQNVNSLLAQTSSAYADRESETSPASMPAERRDYFALHRENLGASPVEVWFESIQEGIKALALGVYEAIETVVKPLR
jgi:hypothetical protein